MPMNLMGGAIAGLGALLVILSLRWILAFVSSTESESPLRVATMKTGKWTIGIVGAVATLTATGLVQFNQFIMGSVEFIATHPYFASNIGITGLGAGAVSGMLTVSTGQYVGLALAIVGLVFLVTEVESA